MPTLRKTERFELHEGGGGGRGTFMVFRLCDDWQTLRDTGAEGKANAERLMRLSESEFDAECEAMEFSE